VEQFQSLHELSSVGALIMGLGFVVAAVYLIYAIFKGRPAGSNPWGALTYEWTTPSPPSHDNFAHSPALVHGPYDYDKIVVEKS
jgi:cytochrome c oxidase subunit 1